MNFISTEIVGPAELIAKELPGEIYKADNKDVMTLLLNDYQGRINCIYLDPPFDVGTEFEVKIPLDQEKTRYQKICAFRDKWSAESREYEKMARERLELAYQLLSMGGALFLHCDYRTTALYRLMLDKIFGSNNYINELIWFYKTGGVPEKLGFSKKHDTIHFYVKSRKEARWNPQKEKSYLKHKYGFSNIKIKQDEKGLYTLVNCRDVIDLPALRGNQPERVNYPTQKPEALLERLILATTSPGEIVADFFCGSGTTGVVAAKNNRRWILADQSDHAITITRKRIEDLANLSSDKMKFAYKYFILPQNQEQQ